MDGAVKTLHKTSICTEQETGNCENDRGSHRDVGASSREEMENVAVR